MRRTTVFLVALVAMLGFIALPAVAGKASVVSAWQYGIESNSVQMGNYFSLKGSGFKTFSPAWVCLTGQLCVKTDVASDGSFNSTHRLDYPGTYRIEVYQWRNRSGQSSDVAFTGSLTVQ